MTLTEILAFEVGSAIAKSILKIWLKDSTIVQDISLSLVDLIKSRTTDKIAQWTGQKQFEEIGIKVGESLFPIFEVEGRRLEESSRTAVALAVAETLNNATSKIIVQHNLEPSKLAKHLLEASTVTKQFNETENALYERVVSESCEYIIDIASQLPSFTENTFAEILKRESQLLEYANKILQEVRFIREQINWKEDEARFELEYRRAVVRNLDVLELFGTDITSTSRRYRLSVAYVTLSVAEKSFRYSKREREYNAYSLIKNPERTQREGTNKIVSVNEALASSQRLLIRGLAGSGKTTLLQWIAVKASLQSFSGGLNQWNDSLPFYIRLRQCVQSGLPAPEAFPKFISTAIIGIMPNKWVHSKLISGHAIILIDGIDEVPTLLREDVRKWLNELIETYPKVRFIVTSRPHAIEEGWMSEQKFKDAELQPMGLSDINAFIDHWHDAISEDLYEEEDKIALISLANHLKEDLKTSRSKRNLATNPLLCAMLCALHRERQQHLPSDRIELYEACCQMLIERRDKERRVELSDYPILTYRQKRALLEDLAYWLVKNDWSDTERQEVDNRFSSKLTKMQNIPHNISGVDIRRLFIERTGIIREPIVNRIDFTHRTFQEFLAAKAALDEGDIGLLVQNAHNDQWRDVIILASGLATLHIREKLLSQLISRGDSQELLRHQLHFLAVSCLETSIDLGQDLKSKIENRLSKLVPPKDIQEARDLAKAGQLATPYLFKNKLNSNFHGMKYCIHALGHIGGDAAIEALEEYAEDAQKKEAEELYKAWNNFDKEIYAKRVLARLRHFPEIDNISTLNGFQYMTRLTSLHLNGCARIKDLSPLSNLALLTSLTITGSKEIINLNPLANLTQLKLLNLAACSQISDLSPLAGLTQLTKLNLSGCGQIDDLNPLAYLKHLTSLHLPFCGKVHDLRPLANLTKLISLNLAYSGDDYDLHPLQGLSQLTSLNLSGCVQIIDLSPLAYLTQLTSLNLCGCIQIINLGPLTSLTRLKSLDLSNCPNITDFTSLTGLSCLMELRLHGLKIQTTIIELLKEKIKNVYITI